MKTRRWKKGVRRFVYAAQNRQNGCIKIGCSYDPGTRMNDVGPGAILLAVVKGGYETEKWYQRRLRAHRTGTNFRPHSTEWFNPTPEVLLVVSEMMFVQGAQHVA